MRLLLLLVLLVLAGVVLAAEVQPTAEDWTALQSLAEMAHRQNKALLGEIDNALADAQRVLQREPANAYYSRRAAELKALQARREQAKMELGAIVNDPDAMTGDRRTRTRFLEYRRVVKRVAFAVEQDRQQLYAGYERGSFLMPEFERTTELLTFAPPPAGLDFTWQTFPRLDGSTTAQPLAALLACRCLGLRGEWLIRRLTDIRNSEGTFERILVPVCGEPSAQEPSLLAPGLRLQMTMTGTPTAYTRLINGTNAIILVARPPSPDEEAQAAKAGVAFELRPIALDAFVFIVNRRNPVDSLTVAQIQDIYQDNVLRWSELGGVDRNVVAYQREHNSGSQDTMEQLVMKGLAMAAPGERMIGYGMGGPYNRLTQTEDGIAYTFYYYHIVQSNDTTAVRNILRGVPRADGAMVLTATPAPPPLPPLKMLAVNGIAPSPATIADGTYPYITPVYVVIRKDQPAGTPAVRLRDWLLTPAGQALVKESGYVPIAGK
jgi:phosphate transport system substrate-binding protein